MAAATVFRSASLSAVPGRSFLFLLAASLICAACGGGLDQATGSAQEAHRSFSAAAGTHSSTTTADVYPAAAPGTTRMTKSVHWEFGVDPRNHYEQAEDIVSQFDVLGIPIDLVDCGWPSDAIAIPASGSIIRIILDVRSQDVEIARQLGLVEYAGDPPPVILSRTCTLEYPNAVADQRIQGYARRVYPELFSGYAMLGQFQSYRYRLYGRGNYLGTIGEDVYVHNGRDWNFLYVGKVKDFIPHIDGIAGAASSPSASR